MQEAKVVAKFLLLIKTKDSRAFIGLVCRPRQERRPRKAF